MTQTSVITVDLDGRFSTPRASCPASVVLKHQGVSKYFHM